jgi:probable rRNA maturation factor
MPDLLQADTVVEDDQWPDLSGLTEKCFETVTSNKFESLQGGVVAILLSNDERLQQLNRDFRGKDKPTNVLSFPAGEPLQGAPADMPQLIGDIALSFETCAREASEKGIAFEHHAAHLIIHGLLHLFGYDHIEEKDAAEMEALEIELLAQMGIKNPYEV